MSIGFGIFLFLLAVVFVGMDAFSFLAEDSTES